MESTNDKIIDLLKKHLGNTKFGMIIVSNIKKRLKIGDKKFKQEMPFGKYEKKDVSEELEDALIYLLSMENFKRADSFKKKIINMLSGLELTEREDRNG